MSDNEPESRLGDDLTTWRYHAKDLTPIHMNNTTQGPLLSDELSEELDRSFGDARTFQHGLERYRDNLRQWRSLAIREETAHAKDAKLIQQLVDALHKNRDNVRRAIMETYRSCGLDLQRSYEKTDKDMVEYDAHLSSAASQGFTLNANTKTMSQKLNPEELAAKRFPTVDGDPHPLVQRAYYAEAIRDVAQPIADELDKAIDERDDYRKALEAMFVTFQELEPLHRTVVCNARAILAKHNKP